MQKLIVLTSALLTLLLLSGCEQSAETPVQQEAAAEAKTSSITNTDLQARIDNDAAPVVLDVRSVDEYSAGHIKGALNIAHTDMATSLATLPQDRSTEIVVHCHSGRRAAEAEATLAELGFTNVRHLEGDYVGWQEAGLPLE